MSMCHICLARPCLGVSSYTSGLVSVSPSQYPVLKLPTSTGDNFGIVKLLISTHTQLGAHLGARLSHHLKFATCRSAPCCHCIHTTSLIFNLPSPPCMACTLIHDITPITLLHLLSCIPAASHLHTHICPYLAHTLVPHLHHAPCLHHTVPCLHAMPNSCPHASWLCLATPHFTCRSSRHAELATE